MAETCNCGHVELEHAVMNYAKICFAYGCKCTIVEEKEKEVDKSAHKKNA